MRKGIAYLLITALCITILSPALSARQWDPNGPFPFPWLQGAPDRPAGDDTGWADVDEAPGHDVDNNMLLINSIFIVFPNIVIIDISPVFSILSIKAENNGSRQNANSFRSRATSTR